MMIKLNLVDGGIIVGKHAYLIMAHGLINQLCLLMKAIDHKRNDIYLHIDKKCDENFEIIKDLKLKSNVYFVDRINVTWGGESIVKAELILLEAATKNGPYDFYHLLSGQDFPLKKQEEILKFYDQNSSLQFISCRPITGKKDKSYFDRLKYWYPLQDVMDRNSSLGKFIRKFGTLVQQLIGVNRLDENITYGVGSQFFDITDEFAKYVLQHKDTIKEMVYKTLCSDEMFLQTIYLNSPFFNEDKYRFHSYQPENEYIEGTYFDVMRAIDWKRGRPHVWQFEDLDILLKSRGCKIKCVS